MIDEQWASWVCERYMTSPFEPGTMFKKIHIQRYDDGWYVICMIYKRLRHSYDTIAARNQMKRKLTIIGEFFVDDAGEIRLVDITITIIHSLRFMVLSDGCCALRYSMLDILAVLLVIG